MLKASMAYVKKTEVREFVKKKGLRVSEEVFKALDKAVEEILKKAIERAKGNNRKTLRAIDI